MANYYAVGSNMFIDYDGAFPSAFKKSENWSLIMGSVVSFTDTSFAYSILKPNTFMFQQLQRVEFPVCTIIGASCFSNCSYLSFVDFPSCTEIGSEAFRGCTSLLYQQISFPACTKIYDGAFSGCTQLSSYSFCSQTSFIGSSAFYGAGVLNVLFFNQRASEPLIIGTSAFYSKTARSVSIYHKNNPAVLNYNWSGDKITPTFIQLL